MWHDRYSVSFGHSVPMINTGVADVFLSSIYCTYCCYSFIIWLSYWEFAIQVWKWISLIWNDVVKTKEDEMGNEDEARREERRMKKRKVNFDDVDQRLSTRGSHAARRCVFVRSACVYYNAVSRCMMTCSCLISDNTICECRQYLAIPVAVRNCQAFLTSNREPRRVLRNTLRNACESLTDKLNLVLQDCWGNSSFKYLTNDRLC
jgi:hypothetical protein